MRARCIAALLFLSACATTPRPTSFHYVAGHLLGVPVRINDSIDAHFVLDTGIGVNIISKSICERIGCKSQGQYTGKRMSGQAVTLPMSTIAALGLENFRRKNVPIGILDLTDFQSADSHIDGFVSLGFFENTPFTIDYRAKTVAIENAKSLAEKLVRGVAVPIVIERDHESLTVSISLEIPSGPPAIVEVDTGSGALILDEKYMARLGVDPDGADVKKVEGKDETGHLFTRYFVKLAQVVHPVGASQLAQTGMQVMFQKIIHDGLIGDAFLNRFAVTYDLPQRRMIFIRPPVD